jgi:hypothetical protein
VTRRAVDYETSETSCLNLLKGRGNDFMMESRFIEAEIGIVGVIRVRVHRPGEADQGVSGSEARFPPFQGLKIPDFISGKRAHGFIARIAAAMARAHSSQPSWKPKGSLSCSGGTSK